MGWPSRKIAQYPVVLSLSLKRRLIPRCSVVKVLFLKGVIDENFRLGSVLLPVEKHFLENFNTLMSCFGKLLFIQYTCLASVGVQFKLLCSTKKNNSVTSKPAIKMCTTPFAADKLLYKWLRKYDSKYGKEMLHAL
ncbi:unnamed protein product [Prunus brigantina]